MQPPRLAAISVLAGAVLGACAGARPADPAVGPGVTFPARFAEGDSSADSEEPAPSASAVASASASARPPSFAPDPEPLALTEQWELEIGYDRGHVSLTRATPRRFARPVVTARKMGRWAVELWIGRELIDRVRFDFPMLGAEPPPVAGRRRSLRAPPSLAAGATVSASVLVPNSPRARRAVLVDRATGAEEPLPWPPLPDAPIAAPPSASAPSAVSAVPPASAAPATSAAPAASGSAAGSPS